MKGLELAREFYAICRPKLAQTIPDLLDKACVGLVGEGSECFGTDDEISQDHDSGPAFCLWLPAAVLQAEKERLEQAFAALPTHFQGQPSRLKHDFGHGRLGPLSIEGFYQGLLGQDKAPSSLQEWLIIPEFQLACATNGEIFEDQLGMFSAIRENLLKHYPPELKLTKLAARCLQMAQAGQYNLPRALARRDKCAALLALARFVEAALSAVYLINKRYMPFYKHAGRLVANLPLLGQQVFALVEELGANPSCPNIDTFDPTIPIEDFCSLLANYLRENDLSEEPGQWLWTHAPSIMRQVKEPLLRRQNLLALP